MSGFYGDLSPEQDSALADFKKRVQVDVDDHTSLRFLRARKFDVEKASDLYLKDIKWREENKIDEVLNGPPMPVARMGQLETLVACAHHGFDKKGRPLYIEKTGKIPVDGMLSWFTDAEMLHAHIWGNEYSAMRAKEGSKRVGKTVDTFASILDLEGLTSSHKKLLEYVKVMATVDQDHYPERMGFMAVINCPWYFPMFWSIVSSWIDPVTRSKFLILGSDYKEKLLELIDADQLPEEYGGTCKGACGKTPCITVHDQEKALKAFEVDESTLNMDQVDVPAGHKVEKTLKAAAGSVFAWYIKTASHDLQVDIKFDSDEKSAESVIVVHPKRFPTSEIPVQGSFICKTDGELKVVFDNTFSYWTSKTVRYSITATAMSAQ